MKKIGIFIKYNKSIFTNGCIQQGYFVLKTLRKFANCNFITTDKDFKKFNLVDENIDYIDSSDKLDIYDIIIFSSAIITNISYLSYCKITGILLINLMVGNYYMLNQEELVFNTHGVLKTMYNSFIDEIWIMPMYKHNKEYIEFICNKPVKVVPYVWDPTFVDNFITLNDINPQYTRKNSDKLNILILEPNMSTHKTCLVPLLIANQFFMRFPNKLNKIYVLCRPTHDYKKALGFLDIVKFNKIVDYDRHVSLLIFDKLNKLTDNFVIISSNIRNELNFLHLESFHLNIPIIHNCKPFEDNGLYYEDNDNGCNYNKAVDYLHTLSIKTIPYKNPINTINENYHPENEVNIEYYKNTISNLTINEPFINIFRKGFSKLDRSSIQKLNTVVIYQNDTIFNIDILMNNIRAIEHYELVNFKIIVYSREQLSKIDTSIVVEYEIIPLEHIVQPMMYVMSTIRSDNVLLMDNNKVIRFNINALFEGYDLVYLELIKNKDLLESKYNTDYWIIKNTMSKMGYHIEINLLNSEFIFYKNTNKIINMTKYMLMKELPDWWLIITVLLLIQCTRKISLSGEPYYMFDKDNKFIGDSIISNNIPILLNFSSGCYNKICKFIKSKSNLTIQQNNKIIYRDIQFEQSGESV